MDKLPAREFYTIVCGGVLLAANAGYINVVSISGIFPGVTVSHVTGSVSRIAISVSQLDADTFILVTTIILSFMFGSFVAGFIVGDTKFKFGNAYAYALFIESAALFGSYLMLKQQLVFGEWLAAFACGLQNAICTSYSGMVVRTTHMTGLVTDIGNILGQAARTDTKPDLWRLKVLFPLLGGFIIGGFFGQLGWTYFREYSLLMPSIFVGAIGIAYLSTPFIQQAIHQAKVEQEKLSSRLYGAFPGLQFHPDVATPTNEAAKALAADVYSKIRDRNVDQDVDTFMKELIRFHQEDSESPIRMSVAGRP